MVMIAMAVSICDGDNGGGGDGAQNSQLKTDDNGAGVMAR